MKTYWHRLPESGLHSLRYLLKTLCCCSTFWSPLSRQTAPFYCSWYVPNPFKPMALILVLPSFCICLSASHSSTWNAIWNVPLQRDFLAIISKAIQSPSHQKQSNPKLSSNSLSFTLGIPFISLNILLYLFMERPLEV